MDIELTCNTPDEVIFANCAKNAVGKEWLTCVPAHDGHAVIVGGGPSMADNLHTIIWRQGLGQTVFALNGACGYLNRHGITPDYQVILDAREENVSLIGEALDHLISSQCHPSLFERLPEARLWHPAMDGIEDHLPDYDEEYALVGGGTTVGLSSMALAYALGYRKLHLFGYDCSHREGQGHAYVQRSDALCKVRLGGRTYTASLAMARQAELFPDMCNTLIDLGCVITVNSTGLISAVLEEMRLNPKKDD